jgi:transcription initiation factor IIE alpha subunit
MLVDMSSENPVVTALESQIERLNRELNRLTKLATAGDGLTEQQRYWDMAQETQRELRMLRHELASFEKTTDRPQNWLRSIWPRRRDRSPSNIFFQITTLS